MNPERKAPETVPPPGSEILEGRGRSRAKDDQIKRVTERKAPETAPPPGPEIQEGRGRSRAKDDEMKRVIKQHPLRDEPRVDSVEENETPRP